MIDLTKEQIVNPPVKCWVRDDETLKWCPRWLTAIKDGWYITIDEYDRSSIDAFRYGRCAWRQCSLIDPTVPIKKVKKWETVMDIPPELWGRALVKNNNDDAKYATILHPNHVSDRDGVIKNNLHYLPLGQPLDGEWLPFESEVKDEKIKIKTLWLIIGIFLAYLALIPFSYIQGNQAGYDRGFEEGRTFERELLLNTDSSKVKGCQFGYIPDSLYRMNLPELKDSGSYKIRK